MWFADFARRNPHDPLVDCATCMTNTPAHTRQLMGCGFEAPIAHPECVWEPARAEPGISEVGFAGAPLRHCPGYTVRLPIVHECARAHAHRSKGALESFNGGRAAPEAQLAAMEILDVEVAAFQRWKLTPRSKGGGADGD